MVYTIGVPECSNDIVFVVWSNAVATLVRIDEIVDNDRVGRPVTQILPDRCSVSAEKFQIETAW